MLRGGKFEKQEYPVGFQYAMDFTETRIDIFEVSHPEGYCYGIECVVGKSTWNDRKKRRGNASDTSAGSMENMDNVKKPLSKVYPRRAVIRQKEPSRRSILFVYRE
jgi:hypothetical protein